MAYRNWDNLPLEHRQFSAGLPLHYRSPDTDIRKLAWMGTLTGEFEARILPHASIEAKRMRVRIQGAENFTTARCVRWRGHPVPQKNGTGCETTENRCLRSSEFLQFLQRTYLHSNAGRLGFEDSGLTCEWVNTLASLFGRLFHGSHFQQAWQSKFTH